MDALVTGKEYVSLSREQIEELIPKYYPARDDIEVKIDGVKHIPSERFSVTAEEIRQTFQDMNSSKSPGVSGIGVIYWKKLVADDTVVGVLKQIFESLVNDPILADEIPLLYQFRLTFIPKDENGYRPIAC